MAINNISNTVRSAMCDAYVDALDTGATDPGGDIQIHTAAFATLLAELEFSAPAFGAASNGVATANAISDEASAPASGTAAVCRFRDRANTTHSEGTVTATSGGGDVELSNTTIASTDVVSMSSGTVTMPAS